LLAELSKHRELGTSSASKLVSLKQELGALD